MTSHKTLRLTYPSCDIMTSVLTLQLRHLQSKMTEKRRQNDDSCDFLLFYPIRSISAITGLICKQLLLNLFPESSWPFVFEITIGKLFFWSSPCFMYWKVQICKLYNENYSIKIYHWHFNKVLCKCCFFIQKLLDAKFVLQRFF